MSDIRIELAIKIGENKGAWSRTFKEMERKADDVCGYNERQVIMELFDVLQTRINDEQEELLNIIRNNE